MKTKIGTSRHCPYFSSKNSKYSNFTSEIALVLAAKPKQAPTSNPNFIFKMFWSYDLIMELISFINPILSGIITGIILLTVSELINRIQEMRRCRSLIAFLRLEIINNYRLLNEFDPSCCKQLPILEARVWEKISTEIICKLPFVLTNHLIVHYYFIQNSSKLIPTISLAELERQKNRIKFLIKRLQNFSK